jgi:hypothetical protein
MIKMLNGGRKIGRGKWFFKRKNGLILRGLFRLKETPFSVIIAPSKIDNLSLALRMHAYFTIFLFAAAQAVMPPARSVISLKPNSTRIFDAFPLLPPTPQ